MLSQFYYGFDIKICITVLRTTVSGNSLNQRLYPLNSFTAHAILVDWFFSIFCLSIESCFVLVMGHGVIMTMQVPLFYFSSYNHGEDFDVVTVQVAAVLLRC